MTFLQSYMLWGMLAVAVPVAIHFWYQKRGKTIKWAAMRWLGGQTTLQHRGLRLNEVWLMILRCLVVALLALILSKPVIEWLKNTNGSATIHLVQPDQLITDTYRFELEKALREGGQVYWLGHAPERMSDLAKMPSVMVDLSVIQRNINVLSNGSAHSFRLYLRNDIALPGFQKVYIPGSYQLFSAVDSSRQRPVSLSDKKPVYEKPVHILVENGDAAERQTIQAGLAALAEVYGFVFEIANKNGTGKHYDWVFTNKLMQEADPRTRYIVSGNSPEWNASASVTFLPDSLKIAGSELVESGRFPEWLGDLLVKDLKLQPAGILSNRQLAALFQRADAADARMEAVLRPWLLLGLMMVLTAERWLALRKTAGGNG
ncbi:N-terminal double-transmembrane domain-containing protein [Dyadobacter soli]|uniref:N-terminal double-transmembrane domain-containing protein n=1 Tax=Dyadobacter soli TaxID=659014 RepID=A0A1G7UI81_9BACT|nr:BatA domain-containing protein [Dyadobacter soli]SDG47214.1 N-terminal double-transmembrane domain-containing protein [Dyadobacter soli]